jgi:hypothetical protein
METIKLQFITKGMAEYILNEDGEKLHYIYIKNVEHF